MFYSHSETANAIGKRGGKLQFDYIFVINNVPWINRDFT